jgi:hypothetical protein
LSQDGTVYVLGPYAVRVKGPGGTGDLNDIIAIAAWGYYTLALARDGSVYEWGHYMSNGTYVSRPLPVKVEVGSGSPLTNITAIAAGENFGLALDKFGHVWAWGDNTAGQLGLGLGNANPARSEFATRVKDSGSGYLSDIVSISAGGYHCLALDSRGWLWRWGNYWSRSEDIYIGNPERGYVTGFSAGGDLVAMILSGMSGDLNGDGTIGLADAVICLKLLAGISAGEVRLDGVVSEEGMIGLREALFILQGIAGMRGRD